MRKLGSFLKNMKSIKKLILNNSKPTKNNPI